MVSVDRARLRASAAIRFLGCAVACSAALFARMAAAEYPEKPIRIVTPFPAGSVADAVARPIATHLAETWNQPVVVDNRGGAGGTIAAEIVAKSLPDGHTLLIGANGPNAVNPSLIKNLPYDSQRAFAAITIAATTNFLLTVPSSMPVKSVRDLIDVARSKPGQLRYATPGIGSTPHLAGELFKSLARVDMVHVPYKGSTQYVVDLVAGRIDVCICDESATSGRRSSKRQISASNEHVEARPRETFSASARVNRRGYGPPAPRSSTSRNQRA
jgi:tripartite-type tricarboxylate transporter receptor subunit TctC